MKKSMIVLLSVIGILVMSILWGISAGNQMVTLDERVKEKWSQVENVYQRRQDLIPNLVSTVKGYAKHESEVFEEVTKARSQVGQIQVKGPEDLKKFDQAQGQLSSALSRLLVVAERYPDLKADKGFLELQSQLEGTENRISVERMRFNEASRDYNTYIRQFPQSVVAGMRGFQAKAYFESEKGAKVAPKVEF
ncbi:MAG: LemA family protein [Bdellovibrio sp.]|nr:LemA family protein [Bdellovibrio sp.]